MRVVGDDELAALVHAHHAVVLTETPATCGQACFRVLSHGQHGRHEGKAEHGQQQDGDEPTQWLY